MILNLDVIKIKLNEFNPKNTPFKNEINLKARVKCCLFIYSSV